MAKNKDKPDDKDDLKQPDPPNDQKVAGAERVSPPDESALMGPMLAEESTAVTNPDGSLTVRKSPPAEHPHNEVGVPTPDSMPNVEPRNPIPVVSSPAYVGPPSPPPNALSSFTVHEETEEDVKRREARERGEAVDDGEAAPTVGGVNSTQGQLQPSSDAAKNVPDETPGGFKPNI